jgi:hypothetical protein
MANLSGIGRGVPQPIINDARLQLEETSVHTIYSRYESVPFVFEILSERSITKHVVDV